MAKKKKNQKNIKIGRTKTSPTISACMIVKNEEEMLPRCLSSIKGHVDEIVVVDTGSTDRTVEIAESFGARIYHHAWEENFSKHRNQSIDYSSSAWVFIIDADEQLMPGSGEAIREATQVDENVDALFVKVECEFDEGRGRSVHNSLRLFRNNGLIRYRGRVHNDIVGEINPKHAPNICLFHYGYNLGAEMAEKKFKRTTRLLKMDIQDYPDDPRSHHYLAVSYLSRGMFESAVKEAETAVYLYKEKDIRNTEFLKSFFVAAMANINLGRFAEAELFALEAIKLYPKHLDSHFALSWVYLEQKRIDLFWEHVQYYFDINREVREKPEQFGAIIHTTINSIWLAHFFKAYALLLDDKHTESAEELQSAFTLCPDMSEYHRLLGRYYLAKGEREKAEREFMEGLSLSPGKQSIMWDLYTLYKEQGDLEGQEHWLQKIVINVPEDETGPFLLGVVKMVKREFQGALDWFSDVLRKNEQRADAIVNASICLRKLGRLGESLEYAIRAKAVAPRSLEALANLAYAYNETGDYNRAVAAFRDVADLYPNEIDVHTYIAEHHFRLGDIEACVKDCDEMLRILGLPRNNILNSLTDLGSHFLAIGIRLSELRKPKLASLCFNIAALSGHGDTSALLVMANSLISISDFCMALPYLEQAARIDPGNVDVLSRVEQVTVDLEKMYRA